jgi:16S rRNA (uracil1498-N3)-methyltransferase
VVVAIGPEGGFTDEEVERAVALGWLPIGLGPTVLRVETAGLVAAARALGLVEDSGSTLEQETMQA